MTAERPYSTIYFAPDKGGTGERNKDTPEKLSPERALGRILDRVAGKSRRSLVYAVFSDLVDLRVSHLDESGEVWERVVDRIEARKSGKRYKAEHKLMKGLIDAYKNALVREYRHKGVYSYAPVRRDLATNLQQAQESVNPAVLKKTQETRFLRPPRRGGRTRR